MSWKPYEPPVRLSQQKKSETPVTVQIRAEGRFEPRLKIVVRPELLQGADWWEVGVPVSLLVGEDEHQGSIRIEKGGSLKLQRTGGKMPRATLSVPPPPGVVRQTVKLAMPSCIVGKNSIDIKLPVAMWATVPSAGEPLGPPPNMGSGASAPAAAPVKKGEPFRGLGSTGPHPHPAMQRPGTGAPR